MAKAAVHEFGAVHLVHTMRASTWQGPMWAYIERDWRCPVRVDLPERDVHLQPAAHGDIGVPVLCPDPVP